MKITIPYTFTESYVPPRCRKPRDRNVEANITLTIREITEAEAPIAIIHHARNDRNQATGAWGPVEHIYRWFAGRLWVVMNFRRSCGAAWETQTAEQFAKDPYGMRLAYWEGGRSKDENRKALMHQGRNTLFIDGVRYRPAGEPRFCIYTFGLGHNHGGTSLSVDNHYNINISHASYFRIDQRDQAIAAANAIAQGRGDTESVFTDEDTDTFEILIPEALKLQPNKDHGDGDPFINKAEKLIEGSVDRTTAGLGLICLLGSELNRK